MADRLIPGLSKSVSLQSLTFEVGHAPRPRRVFAAFMTGAALFAAGWVGLQSESAGAAGGRTGFLSFLTTVLGAEPVQENAPRLVETPIEPTARSKHVKRRSPAATRVQARRPVCVRLCDGYFFPLATARRAGVANDQAACSDQCPDASTALYFLPSGSDRIEDASSARGERYTALATALRYRSTGVDACTCHATVARATPYWRDPTLRKGDAVMTPSGFMVYRGGSVSRFARENFTRLAAASLPRDRRAELTAIERVSVLTGRADERPQIAVAAPSARTSGVNEIRFVERTASATN